MGNVSGYCVLYAEFFSTGSESECSDFLRMTPPSPSTVQLLKFSVQSLCGSAVSLHDDVPHHVWNPDLPTTVIIPGKRMARVQPAWVRTMAQELLAVGRENVLAVDWLVQPEVTLTAAAKQVGRKLARIIQQLLGLRPDTEMFHLIGFGVGAHIAGIAGSWLNGTVGRITGLDPFAPEFSAPNSSVYLDRADGQYVEIIHTNFNPTEPVPALGFSSPLGHIDYYVGLGFELPGCPSGLIKREDYLLCSHRRAHQIYTSSIRAPCRHFAFPCPSLDNFQHTLCTLCYQPGLTTCPEMGYNLTWLPTTRPPLFSPTTVFLTVAPSPPYCVTPLLLKLKMGGISSMEAKLYIQLEGNTNKTSTMLVSGKEIREFAANKNYEFLISSDSAGDFHTITLEFNTQRLLHLDWRKRTISIDHLLLSHLPLYKRKFYEAWNIAVVENRRVKVLLEEILV
ncbi:phospholipase A1 member A-like [Astyanax mexicanus]|uniref:phospholipase A1 member A-like n=1 Tax=Astyanax mexicanus TaxID=7994 RepID=UPI0020CAF867|nr:phospholipase A1 member A-like [Astyanax mexicanus]